uniref:NADH dehydrogenase subunit 2 n=1 Tax=Leucoptera coffeella TaxID=1178041 RepID=UPI002E79E2C9|nr:NADH dehydrogenase subunit 2 [Leucoptera coffeella]WPR14284.1 NADH dehydrogenase subunit 2 [Leucoptera coffeella]
MNYIFINSNKMFFLFILMISTMISISSNSWFGCWIGLEINLLSFIPLISNSKNLLSSEASLKYFLTQSIASINLLFLIIMMSFFKQLENYNIMMLLMNLPLLMKMGSAPFHFWFPNLIEGLSWMNAYIIMTWQKITPLILISYNYNFYLISFIAILNAFVGAIGGFNQMSLRKILTFSSINNLSWMLISIMISENLWMLYFFIYCILNFMLCYFFNLMNIFYINQIYFYNMKNFYKILLAMNLFSLGGLPPFMGFLSKWLVINFLINNNMLMLTFLMIMSSLIMLYYYIRIMYSTFLINYMKLKWFNFKIKNNFNKYYFICMYMFSFLGIPISTLTFF